MPQDHSTRPADQPGLDDPTVVPHSSKPASKKKAKATKKVGQSPETGRGRYFLPTERITFRRQLDLLRGYVAASGPTVKPVLNKDVGAFVQMTESTTSMSNAFFTQNGFLAKVGSGFVPSQEVVSFQRAYQWDQATAAYRLAPLLQRSWFGQTLLPRLTMGPLDEDRAIQLLAEEANTAPKFKGNIRLLLDYLEAGGVIAREGNQIRASSAAEAAIGADDSQAAPTTTVAGEPAAIVPAAVQPSGDGFQTTFSAAPTAGVVQFHVSVRVDMKEFSGWRSDRIAAFFSGIAQVLTAKGTVEKSTGGE